MAVATAAVAEVAAASVMVPHTLRGSSVNSGKGRCCCLMMLSSYLIMSVRAVRITDCLAVRQTSAMRDGCILIASGGTVGCMAVGQVCR